MDDRFSVVSRSSVVLATNLPEWVADAVVSTHPGSRKSNDGPNPRYDDSDVIWDVTFGHVTHVYVRVPFNKDENEAHRVAREELAKITHTSPDRMSAEWSARIIMP